MSGIHFPPYGHMMKEWEDLTQTLDRPPSWSSATSYAEWFENMTLLLGDVLWPRFLEGSWTGKAVASMEALTDLDFKLFIPFRRRIDEPQSDVPGLSMLELFRLEDQQDAKTLGGPPIIDRGPDRALRLLQVPILGEERTDQFLAAFKEGIKNRTGNVDLDLKVRMQRPRAYQMAWIMGKVGFSHQQAGAAISPSLISGHGLVTLMGGVSVYRWALDQGLPGASIESLRKFTVGVGDRRVYAGVHYPSDNLSSWVTGLLLCPEVGIPEADIAWLWDTIRTESDVYRAIDEAVSNGGTDNPYRPALTLLTQIGGRHVKTIGDAMEWLDASQAA